MLGWLLSKKEDCSPVIWSNVFLMNDCYSIIYERFKDWRPDYGWLISSIRTIVLLYCIKVTFWVHYAGWIILHCCWYDFLMRIFYVLQNVQNFQGQWLNIEKFKKNRHLRDTANFLPHIVKNAKSQSTNKKYNTYFSKIQRLLFKALFYTSSSISVYHSFFHWRFGATEGFNFRFWSIFLQY